MDSSARVPSPHSQRVRDRDQFIRERVSDAIARIPDMPPLAHVQDSRVPPPPRLSPRLSPPYLRIERRQPSDRCARRSRHTRARRRSAGRLVGWSAGRLVGWSAGRLVEAESLYLQLASVYRRHPMYMRNDAVTSLLRIAGRRIDAGDLPGAIAAYDSLVPQLAVRTRSDSFDHAAHLGSRGDALATLGRFERAIEDVAEALRINERLLGAGSFATGQVLQPYAGAMLFTGHFAAAESLARRSLDISRREFGDSPAGTLAAARMLGTILVARNRCADAIPVFSEILSRRDRTKPDADGTVGYTLAYRGFCRAQTGDERGSASDARDGMRITRAMFGEQHYVVGLAENLAGAALGYRPRSGHAEEAERLLVAGAAVLRAALDPAHPRVKDADARVVAFRTRSMGPIKGTEILIRRS